ncbi:MAG: hypothetical protein V3R99_14335 [Thermoguttaceae bacterium]
MTVALLVMFGHGGCSNSSTPIGEGGPTDAEIVGQYEGDLLTYAIDNLNRLEEFDTGTVLPQIIDRLNQWAQTQEMPADWTLDPLIAALPEPLAEMPAVGDLDKPEFAWHDGAALQEAIWMRDLAGWVAGDQTDDIGRAKRLFDWTVRNIQLRPRFFTATDGSKILVRQMPWETLLLGQGTPLDRAWVFILLARQLGLDVALIAVIDSTDADNPEDSPSRTWVAALNSGGKLYLFEPVLGLPIPAPDGIRLDEDGQLDIRPATLAEAAGDPSVLRRLDIDDEDRYPIRPADLEQLEVLIEASPSYLAHRMKLLESRLAGKKKVVLTTDATAQAERWKAFARIARARLWLVPYETIRQQAVEDPQLLRRRLAALAPFQMVARAVLWKGRVRHLKGTLIGEIGEKSATYYYQSARTSNQELRSAERTLLARYYEAAKQLNAQRDQAARMTEEQLQARARQETAAELSMLIRAEQNASFWMGLIAYERGTDSSYDSAIDYFTKRTLDASPNGPWTHAAKYNLARTYEVVGEPEKAVERYQLDTTSPSYFGNLLRARWLRSLQPASDTPEPGTPVEQPDLEIPEPKLEIPEPAVEIPDREDDAAEPEDTNP